MGDQYTYDRLIDEGVDEVMAKHISHPSSVIRW